MRDGEEDKSSTDYCCVTLPLDFEEVRSGELSSGIERREQLVRKFGKVIEMSSAAAEHDLVRSWEEDTEAERSAGQVEERERLF
jgi:hypothetical protein